MNTVCKICDQTVGKHPLCRHHHNKGEAFIETMFQYRKEVRELALRSDKYVDQDSLLHIINKYEEILKEL